MTLEQHAQHIRQLEFKLRKADYGMGMPRDYTEVLRLTMQLAEARRQLTDTIRHQIAQLMDSDPEEPVL